MSKKETVEEAAKEFVLTHDFSLLTNQNHLANRCFQYGAKWQAESMVSKASYEEALSMQKTSNIGYQSKINELEEQIQIMYSEEDMKQFGLYLGDNLKNLKGKTIDEIFEKFKKK
jgi:hypothetical protein